MREAILAIRIENTLSKQQIMELYLKQIFLGRNAYGVEAADVGGERRLVGEQLVGGRKIAREDQPDREPRDQDEAEQAARHLRPP